MGAGRRDLVRLKSAERGTFRARACLGGREAMALILRVASPLRGEGPAGLPVSTVQGLRADILAVEGAIFTLLMAGIYISFPFCRQKCTYCNFASGVFSEQLMDDYLEALRAEIRAAEIPQADTLYVGGGTPSLLDIPRLGRLLEAFGDRSWASSWAEATIEASPGSVTSEKAAGWARLGINRVSLGVQSFVPEVAAAAGRKHTPDDVAREIEMLGAEGISNINVDLIAGLARQTRQSWRISLDWVARLEPPHVSLYMLEVDDESRLGAELRKGGSRYGAGFVPSDDEIGDFYLEGVEHLRRLNIARYEISNFARPGWESRHNLKYWNMEPYWGFGADAHSFDGKTRWGNLPSPAEYVLAWKAGSSVRTEVEAVGRDRWTQDRFITGLRQMAGVQASEDELARFRGGLAKLEERGWVSRTDEGRLRLTPDGVMFSNEVFQEFLAD